MLHKNYECIKSALNVIGFTCTKLNLEVFKNTHYSIRYFKQNEKWTYNQTQFIFENPVW